MGPMIRVYNTPTLIKGDWIFDPEGMGQKENL